ncbi:MAG: hypothetical protein CFE44_11670 [Burkholderiales bacterium PBB4]|nr:MAG: hypothetical protein CFE44_11670 [Burkholderiales bacterium PBB4]
MEQDNAVRAAERVVGGLDAQLSNLNVLVRDWAFWDDMYFFAQKPNPEFVASNMGKESLKNAGLMGILVLAPEGWVVWFQGLPASNGQTLRLQDLAPYQVTWMSALTDQAISQSCGYLAPGGTLLFACASRISRSSGVSTPAGVVVMVRELTDQALKDIEKQSKESFAVLAWSPSDGDQKWPQAAMTFLPTVQLGVRYTPSVLTLDYPLADVLGQPLRTVRLSRARTLVEEGEWVTRRAAHQMAAIAMVTGVVLLLAGHFWLVLPIARLKHDVRAIHKQKAWSLSVRQNRQDEVGALAREVNGLLQVIHHQVQELESMSMTDSLTHLANRRHFDMRLADEFRRVQRKAQPLSLVVLDIDYFKQYNDYYGHPAGDATLQTVAKVLRDLTRQVDVPARIGGEEFAVLLPDTTEVAALQIAEKILSGLRAAGVPHAKSKVSNIVTASAGVVGLTDGSMTPQALLARADQALYAAKAAGRNQALIFTGPS